MPDYGFNRDRLIVKNFGTAGNSDKPGIFLFRSGSIADSTTAVSASLPSIIAVTCSNNTNNVLTKLTKVNAFGYVTISNGNGGIGEATIGSGFIVDTFPGIIKETRLVLRYMSASLITTTKTKKNQLISSSKNKNDIFIDIPIKNNDDSFAVAYKTVNALNKKGNGRLYTASLIDTGDSLSNLSSSLGENMTIGSTFKIRSGSFLSASVDVAGKFTITAFSSGSVKNPDFSGTKVQVGGMKVGSSFKIGNTDPLFKFNIIQQGSGRLNKQFYPGNPIFRSQSLGIELDPDDKKSAFITGSQDSKMYFSSSGFIGVNTKDPKRAFDIVDKSTGVAEIAIKRNLENESTKFWQPNDEVGKIRFIGQSGSYRNENTSGALADILTKVSGKFPPVPGGNQLSGDLIFRANKGGTAEPFEVMQIGVKRGTDSGMGVAITGSMIVSSDVTMSGDVTIGGTLKTTNFFSQTVSSSIIYASGSNVFGDDDDDTHTFTGHITASGYNISASTIIGTIDGGSF